MQKAFFLSFLLVFCLGLCGCFAQQPAQQGDLVYLKADCSSVSSFDTTADWAPLPDSKALIDGDLLTRWSSSYTDNQWATIDFGTAKMVSKVILFWEAAYVVDYDILVSPDNTNWKTVLSLKDRHGGVEELDFTPVKARFVKVLGAKRLNPDWGISLWEIACLGPAKDNPEDRPLASVYPELANKLSGKAATPGEEESPVASPGALSPLEFQKGIVYTSWGKKELEIPASDKTLEYLYQLGVRHLGIMVVWFQETIEEKSITADPKDTPEDNALAHAINKAHSLGMKVMLKPHVDVKDGAWRGDIIPSEDWFKSYKEFILRYAKLAAKYNLEAYTIGTELGNTTLPLWQKQWDDIIKEIKAVYSGKLTYCANWNEYNTVEFWNQLDFVGIDAYFALTQNKDPTKEELIEAWKAHAVDIDSWLQTKKVDKPVVFTEIGYCSADGTNTQPWATLSNASDAVVDQQEQADALDAMLVACTAYPWFKGLYWWSYFPQDRWSPLGYTIRGKKAEEIFEGWLNKL